jgi:ubiquinone/menaquinone biosynthesis C-methylase UbiE
MTSIETTNTHVKEYDDFYSKKDFIHFKQDRIYIQKLCSFLPDPRNSSILDVGCGRGYWSNLFHDCGVGRVVGIDVSQTGLDIARQAVPSAEFILADANHLHFEEDTFDMVFCQGLSDYNTEDFSAVETMGRELLRFSKKDGLFVFAYSTNLSGRKRGNWIQHKPEKIKNYLRSLGCQLEAVYIIDRVIFLRLLGRHVFNGVFSKYTIPAICHLTKLRAHLICIGRKKTC